MCVCVCVCGVVGVRVCVCVCGGVRGGGRATKIFKMYYNLKLIFVTQVMENPENRSDLEKTPTNSPRFFQKMDNLGSK